MESVQTFYVTSEHVYALENVIKMKNSLLAIFDEMTYFFQCILFINNYLFSSGFDPEKFIEQEVPLLIVGTKEVWSY